MLFAASENEWEKFEKENTLFTEERFLPRIMVECGMVKSIGEVKRNKPELVKMLENPDFIEVKWGKKAVYMHW